MVKASSDFIPTPRCDCLKLEEQVALKTYLSAGEITALIDAASTLRDKLIISFLADSVPSYSPLVIKYGEGKGDEIEILDCQGLWERLPAQSLINDETGEELKPATESIFVLDYTPRGKIFTRLKYMVRHQYSGNLVKINTHTAVIEVSPNHSIYYGESPTRIRLGDAQGVHIGNFLCQLNWDYCKKSNSWFFGDNELAYLYGFFFAEGSAHQIRPGKSHCNGRYSIGFSNTNKGLLERTERTFLRVFNKNMVWSKQGTGYKINCFCPEGLYLFFRNQFYTLDGRKKVPQAVLNAPQGIKTSFLQGYYAGDAQPRTKRESYRFDINSPVGALGLLWLIMSSTNKKYSIGIRDDKPTITSIALSDKHLKESKQVKKVETTQYTGYLYDLGTDSNTFVTGVGLVRAHNTGCRVSELLELTVQHIDFDQQLVLVPHLKIGIRKKCPKCGNSTGRRQNFCSKCGANISEVAADGEEQRTRLLGVGPRTLKLCREYLEGRKGDSDHLITISRQMVYKMLRQCADQVGLSGRIILNPETGRMHFVHPHVLRSSLAVDWLMVDDSGKGQKALQDQLGHKRYESTARYIKLTPSRVTKEAEKVRRRRFGN